MIDRWAWPMERCLCDLDDIIYWLSYRKYRFTLPFMHERWTKAQVGCPNCLYEIGERCCESKFWFYHLISNKGIAITGYPTWQIFFPVPFFFHAFIFAVLIFYFLLLGFVYIKNFTQYEHFQCMMNTFLIRGMIFNMW